MQHYEIYKTISRPIPENTSICSPFRQQKVQKQPYPAVSSAVFSLFRAWNLWNSFYALHPPGSVNYSDRWSIPSIIQATPYTSKVSERQSSPGCNVSAPQASEIPHEKFIKLQGCSLLPASLPCSRSYTRTKFIKLN